MILFEMGWLDLLFYQSYVFSGGSYEVYSLQMHEFFLDIFDFLDEINIIFVEFRLRIDDWDDTWGLWIQHEGFHFCDFTKNGIEVVFSDG